MADRFRVYPCAFVALVRAGQIFLLRRVNTGYKDGYWNLPAGHIENGETPVEAALREAGEEAGVILTAANLEFTAALYRRGVGGRERTCADYLFAASQWQGEAHNHEPEKASEGGWFPLGNLPVPMVEGHAKLIEMMQAGIKFASMIEPEV